MWVGVDAGSQDVPEPDWPIGITFVELLPTRMPIVSPSITMISEPVISMFSLEGVAVASSGVDFSSVSAGFSADGVGAGLGAGILCPSCCANTEVHIRRTSEDNRVIRMRKFIM